MWRELIIVFMGLSQAIGFAEPLEKELVLPLVRSECSLILSDDVVTADIFVKIILKSQGKATEVSAIQLHCSKPRPEFLRKIHPDLATQHVQASGCQGLRIAGIDKKTASWVDNINVYPNDLEISKLRDGTFALIARWNTGSTFTIDAKGVFSWSLDSVYGTKNYGEVTGCELFKSK